nr:hypothetical protein Iba_chr01cCG12670 [Ipomoea batatas]
MTEKNEQRRGPKNPTLASPVPPLCNANNAPPIPNRAAIVAKEDERKQRQPETQPTSAISFVATAERRALDVEVKAARVTMVREPIAFLPAGIAGEEAEGVRGLGEESENVVAMERVSDLFMQFEAIEIEGEVAGFAGIEWKNFDGGGGARRISESIGGDRGVSFGKLAVSAGRLANRVEDPFYCCWKLRFRGGSHGSICLSLVETAEVKIFESELPDFR